MSGEVSSFGRVAVVHDWLTGMRGGEAVLEAILDALPGAELFTLFHFPGSVSRKIEARAIHTSSVQSLAARVKDYRQLLPLFPRAVREWDFNDYDLIVSSSHCVAKGVNAKGKPHLCYCHTPMRYIWDRFDDYFPRSKPLRRAAAVSIAPWLRRWDVKTAAASSRTPVSSATVFAATTTATRTSFTLTSTTRFWTRRCKATATTITSSCPLSFRTSTSTWPSTRWKAAAS
jgi:hypothetical protein